MMESDETMGKILGIHVPGGAMKIAKLDQTCGACPEQYEGMTEDGRVIYIRHRHGYGYIEIDDKIVVDWSGPEDGTLAEGQLDRMLIAAGLEL